MNRRIYLRNYYIIIKDDESYEVRRQSNNEIVNVSNAPLYFKELLSYTIGLLKDYDLNIGGDR